MEDLIWCIKLFTNTNNVIIDEGSYYHYVNNEGSAVNVYRENMKELQKKVLKEIEETLIKGRLYEISKERLEIRYVRMIINSLANEAHKGNSKSLKKKLQAVKCLCRDDELKNILKSIDTKNYTFRKRTILYTIKKEWSVYIYTYYTVFNKIVK